MRVLIVDDDPDILEIVRSSCTRESIEAGGEKNVAPTKNYKSQHMPLEEITIEDDQMRADEKAILNSEIEQIKKCLQNINDDYQNVIIWYYLDEFTIPEISAMLKKPEANVRVLVHRAVESLKKELKKKGKNT